MNAVVKTVTILALLFVAGITANNGKSQHSFLTKCSDEVKNKCTRNELPILEKTTKCNAAVADAAFPRIETEVQDLLESHIQASVEFLLMGNVFSQWQENRKGFHNYYTKLSDSAWEDAIALLQHMVIRGGTLKTPLKIKEARVSDRSELATLTKALDIEKQLVHDSLKLMNTSPTASLGMSNDSRSSDEKHLYTTSSSTGADAQEVIVLKMHKHSDGEFSHFLAGEVSNKLILRVKHLANHVNMLSQSLASQSDVKKGFILHLYDTQILK